ncbi:hypothetical protein D9613_006475 [Agrocybe pediades]|uniref:NADH:flavin oxidoreductase/NADH oxidase N-terminal domain-containing protein n=1 Tax=Agrocybe pediades TaxID=84607 RepID=A0A8H4VHV9_9AGAR|nr:hypothetical protein D9613_006475 [Agrocybe pediades]
MYCQLWHVGRVAHPDAPKQKLAGQPVYAPSAVAARGGKFRHIPGSPGYVTSTEVDDPTILINQFKEAAINAKKAGLMELNVVHGANGYLVHQFLDSTSNIRTDKWGGSVENRCRFGLETLKALKEVFGNNVSVKLSPCGGYNDMGMPLQETLDTFSHFISEADKLELSYICLLRYYPMLDVEFDGKKRATQHDVLTSYRPYVKANKLFLNAGVQPKEGEQLVESGKIDGVVMGINWLTHPDLIKRLQHGKRLDNVPDMIHLYGRNDRSDDWRIGYVDYSVAVY